jgi:septal ring factor EnvC (AmiA/AmiB activator)
LVAEDVAKVNPDLVVRDKEGKPYSVRYDQVNAMLLNEFLKERKEVERTIAQLKSEATKQEAARNELESTVAQQQKAMEVLTAQLQEQAAQIQRVSAQLAAASPSRGGLELNKFARRTAGGIQGGGGAPQTVCLSAVALREGGNNP